MLGCINAGVYFVSSEARFRDKDRQQGDNFIIDEVDCRGRLGFDFSPFAGSVAEESLIDRG